MIFVSPAIASSLTILPVVSSITIITTRIDLHDLLQRVGASVIHTAEVGPTKRDSLNVTEPMFLGPVDALEIEPSRRLKLAFGVHSRIADIQNTGIEVFDVAHGDQPLSGRGRIVLGAWWRMETRELVIHPIGYAGVGIAARLDVGPRVSNGKAELDRVRGVVPVTRESFHRHPGAQILIVIDTITGVAVAVTVTVAVTVAMAVAMTISVTVTLATLVVLVVTVLDVLMEA